MSAYAKNWRRRQLATIVAYYCATYCSRVDSRNTCTTSNNARMMMMEESCSEEGEEEDSDPA